VEFAEHSFLEIVTQEKTPIVLGRIEEVGPAKVTGDVSQGEVVLVGVQEITQGNWTGGLRVVLHYARYASNLARIKSGGQGWNGISLEQGKYLVVGLLGGPPEAVAVRAIESPEDTFVKQLRSSLAIERQTDPQLRLIQIRDAVLGGQPFLSGYGHYAAGRLKRIPRSEAVTLETSVLLGGNDVRNRLAAAQTLELELWHSENTDDPLKPQILSAFWNSLGGAPEDLQNYLAEALSRLLIDDAPSSDPKIRDYQFRLRRAVVVQSEAQAIKALENWGRRQNSIEEARKLEQWLRK
jgi:hypothetical protein